MRRRIWNKGERRRILKVWKWPRRLMCHLNVMPCQYIDDPNDNHRRYKW